VASRAIPDTIHPHSPEAKKYPWVPTFDHLLKKTGFVDDMRGLLQTLDNAYDYPVDMEFTANFDSRGKYRINIVQCRPVQITGTGKPQPLPGHLDDENIVIEARGAIIGPSMFTHIDRIIYVSPAKYGELDDSSRYEVAKLIGRVAHHKRRGNRTIMLIGPGRWGTSMPQLGVPVEFTQINTASVLCEVVEMNDNLVPDVSLGTHFFNDIVEFKMLYLAVFPTLEDNTLNRDFLENAPSILDTLIPGETRWLDTVRVIDIDKQDNGSMLYINANAVKQHAVGYFESASEA
jgi:hypothetical protein